MPPINCEYVDPDSFTHKNDNKNLSFLHLNIASLSKHKDELETMLKMINYQFDIIGISETKIEKNVTPIFDLNLQGYTYYGTPTESTKGGTLLYINNKLKCKPRKDLNENLYKSGELESTFVEIINPRKKNFIVGCVYRHPSMDTNEFNDFFLSPMLLKLSKENKTTFFMGDFNIDLMKINSDSSTSNSFDCMTSYLFVPHIIYPSRIAKDITRKTSKTLIDNIFSNSLNYSQGISGNITISISDHLAQFLILPLECKIQPTKKIIYKRDIKKLDRENFILDLLDVNWKEITRLEENDPNLSFYEFETKLNSIIDKHIPLKKLSKKELNQQHKPWITAGIRNSIKRRDKLYKKFIKAKNEDSRNFYHITYKELRNQIVNVCRQSKNNYYQHYFMENANNLKKTWKGIKSIISINSSVKVEPSSLVIEDKLITDHKQIAEEFNKYFSTIAKKLRKNINNVNQDFREYLHNNNENSFFIRATDEHEILRLITELDCKKAIGPHSIPTEIFKYIKPIIVESLTDIINLSFKTGIYIDNLKISKAIPIYKQKGDNLVCSNYRPISLLSNINKIVEKLMHDRLYDFLSKSKSIYDLQFGFRNNHSTCHALTYLTEYVRNALDEGFYASGIFVDLQKAFDTVDHKILLYKLNHYGVRGIANNWFHSYLSNRKQYVSINGFSSDEVIMEHGVPQGSVLGPLLFIIYINDLNIALKYCSTLHYADDTSLLIKNKSLKQMKKYLNFDLRNLTKWLKANKISLNASKTEVIIFRHPNKKINYNLKLKLDGKPLITSQFVKYLGLYIDSHLKWNLQIDTLASKLTRAVGMLSKIRHYVPINALRSIYFAIFSSHLTYGSQIWGQNHNENIKRISRLQNRAIRIINFAGINESASILYKGSHILKFTDHVHLQNTIFTHESLNLKLPNVLNNIFTSTYNAHKYTTRNSLVSKLALPKVNTTIYGLKSIKYQSVKQWNNAIDKYRGQQIQNMGKMKLTKIIKESFINQY